MKRVACDPRVAALVLLLAVGALAVEGPPAHASQGEARFEQRSRIAETATNEQPRPLVWRGACYCKAGAELQCIADLTERECTKQCTESLCDDWFWLERRPCWNWGYGG